MNTQVEPKPLSAKENSMLNTPIRNLMADRLHVVTMDVASAGNSEHFLEAVNNVYRQQISKLANLKKLADKKETFPSAGYLTAFAVNELDRGLWVGTVDLSRTLRLQCMDQTWTINPGRATHVDGHNNERTYRYSIIRDESSIFGCRHGWVLTETRVHRKLPRTDMDENALSSLTTMCKILEDGGGLGREFEQSAELLRNTGLLDFVATIRKWISANRKGPAAFFEYRNLHRAGQSWFKLMELMYRHEFNRDPVFFACHVMTELLLLVENVDDKLKRMLYSKMRRKMNGPNNLHTESSIEDVYTFGPSIFEKVAAVRHHRARVIEVLPKQ